jgi:predicted MFS family arabinose efflux permease
VESRGAVFGTFGFAGSLGIVVLTFIGGRLFDTFGPDATFLMMSGVNAVVALGTVVLFFRLRRTDAATARPT